MEGLAGKRSGHLGILSSLILGFCGVLLEKMSGGQLLEKMSWGQEF